MLKQQLEAIKFHLERTNPEYAPSAQRVQHEGEIRHAHLHGVVELPPLDTDTGVESRTLEQLEDERKEHGENDRPVVELPPMNEGER